MVKQHSVYLDKDRCTGCTDCIKRCPTEAIRVRNKKAVIIDERCIDCGMCIKVCKNMAKKAKADDVSIINQYKVKIAIPAPSLYTQFKGIHNVNKILMALKDIGFDEVIEVAKGAELVTEKTKEYIKNNSRKQPIISSACPAVVKVVQSRFPTLIPNILPLLSPKEITGRMTRTHFLDKGYKDEDIGVFFISPCAAKITNSRYPTLIEKSEVDGVISIKDIYKSMVKAIKKNDHHYEHLRLSSNRGMFWAAPGGEVSASKTINYVAVDGIENVIRILEMIEDNELNNVEYVECLACTGGCLGGPLTVENPFVSRCRMDKLSRYHKNHPETRDIHFVLESLDYAWEKPLKPKEVLRLDEDISEAIKKMEELERIYQELPKINCGSCGSPTCKALAEDIVLKNANIEDCIFMLRKEVGQLAERMVELAEKLPRSIKE
ncbi:iron only hydrogenase large subunit-like protein [Natranaerovirga pectinivora]|uniref:Iron only hydrogenase large subunit-like protein n=1 Tax=Natranaerovirga pectinivora TaxID=682400 RepID=A0A4R3MKK7_9FIRM|nr:[Fe-Fe] hydrogenase large subunit C-terminal domain-containing protein [Natranaerovirga pectinivora]TCT14983.1 iron only hydrogenase large subunit-like protein [Natranaerovirga pectinivora]